LTATTLPPTSAARPRSRRLKTIIGLTVGLLLIGGVAAALPRKSAIPVAGFRLVNAYPHDPGAFSQGLVVADGTLYEGTGQNGESSLREVDLATGRVLRFVPLANEYFGEGVTVLGDRIYQLTWKNRLGLIYDRKTFAPVSSFRYTGEGWGLTTDGEQLILSDGTSVIRFLDPKTFDVTKRIDVRAAGQRVDKLNELEFINGEIWANVWYADRIARIAPKTGEVTGWVDLSTLYPLRDRPSKEHVLNGIAYDATAKRLFVTGKHWPKLYEIAVVEKP
jgi:glutaminyl-peptide cyclotransferase